MHSKFININFLFKKLNISFIARPPFPPQHPTTPNISITLSTESIQIVEVGSTIRLQCNARHINHIPVIVRWFKVDGSLSSRSIESEGILTIRNSQADDSGVYECLASNERETASKNVSVIVGREYFFVNISFKIKFCSLICFLLNANKRLY